MTVWVLEPKYRPKSGQATFCYRVAQRTKKSTNVTQMPVTANFRKFAHAKKKNHVVYIMKTLKSTTAECIQLL